MTNKEQVLVFSLTSCEELAYRVCEELGVEKAPSICRRFADNEIFTRPNVDVRGKDCIVIHSTCNPVNDRLMELLIFIDALKRGEAKTITAIIPYFGYVRQDRTIDFGDPISAKLVANCLREAGCNRVVSVDYHSGSMQPYFENMEAVELYSSSVFADYYRKRLKTLKVKLEDVVIVSPDKGGLERAKHLSKDLGDLPIAVLNKYRPEPNKAVITNIKGEPVEDKYCLMIDDIIDTGGTLCKAAAALKERGAKSVTAYGTHPVLSGDAYKNVSTSALDHLVVSDSVPATEQFMKLKCFRQLTLAPMLAEAIRRINNEESISAMFEQN